MGFGCFLDYVRSEVNYFVEFGIWLISDSCMEQFSNFLNAQESKVEYFTRPCGICYLIDRKGDTF